MNRQLLDKVTEHKDLRIFISSSLKVADHCQHACAKANKMLGLIKRTIRQRYDSYGAALQEPSQTKLGVLLISLEPSLQ